MLKVQYDSFLEMLPKIDRSPKTQGILMAG